MWVDKFDLNWNKWIWRISIYLSNILYGINFSLIFLVKYTIYLLFFDIDYEQILSQFFSIVS